MPPTRRLSKSRFVAGVRCTKLLWWTLHEPDASELAPDDEQQMIFDQGHRVGELARTYVPGGVLIDHPHHEIQARVAATQRALEQGASVIYEAGFLQDDVFVAVDILERRGSAWVLAEVKSTTKVKDEHIPDVAVQWHVVRSAGLPVERAELMHLNRQCRHPDLSNLFVREDVTERARPALTAVPAQVRSLLEMLDGPEPAAAPGTHCSKPYGCPFAERCNPPLPEHHISTLYNIRTDRCAKLIAQGIETLHDLPLTQVKAPAARRQLQSVKTNKLIVERGLRRTLAALEEPIAYLDFETVSPAIPVWPGCRPYDVIPAQFSVHVQTPTGLTHHAWLAEGPQDPRAPCAQALLVACAKANTILVYNATFERRCLDALQAALPHLQPQLAALAARIQDLLPIVRDHIYHPDFNGSFSIKSVLPALVPDLAYDDLEIQDGLTASLVLKSLLLEPDAVSADERKELRRNLERYCERDTVAMVRLHARLGELADGTREDDSVVRGLSRR